MERQLYETLYKVERTYWWFAGQRFLLNNLLQRYYDSKKGLKLLDVGCGTGINMQLLSKFGTAYGIDISDYAIHFCKMRGIKKIKKSNVMNIKFNNNIFDVVTSLGVFYHRNVTDDVKAMKEIYRVLNPGGRFFIFDLAMKCLYGKHDIAFDGIRRYSRRELKLKLEQIGFNVEKISYVNTILFPAVYISRKIGILTKSKPKSEVQDYINPALNSILKVLFKTELNLVNYINYPFGVNIFAVARKS